MTSTFRPLGLIVAAASVLLAGSPAASSSELPDAPQPQQSSRMQPVPDTRPNTDPAIQKRKWSGLVNPGEKAPTLTTHDKLLFAVHEYPSWTTPASILASAAWGLWTDGAPNYGTNAEAFGKRVGIAALNQGIARELTDSLLPIVFHQDPRYYRKAYGSYKDRGEYAVTRVLYNRNDAGKRSINFSDILGLGGAAALTQTYYPSTNVNAGEVFSTWGYSLLEQAGINAFYEFWPDARKRFLHK